MLGIRITIKNILKMIALARAPGQYCVDQSFFGISLDAGNQNNEKKHIKNDCFGGQAAILTRF